MASIQLPAPALEVRDLVKRYPTGTEALRGVSLDVRAGEFFGLLGPNGAGKSTLIHCTTGLARPTGGSVRVFGHDAVEHYEQARLAVGLAPQDVNLDWFLTARGDARLPRRLLRDAAPRAQGARPRAARRLLAHREEGRPHAHALGRHEAAAHPGPGPDAPPAAADPRRADRRRRRGAAAGAVALRAAHQRRGHDDPPHHALPGGGRAAVRPHRLHPRRGDRRARHEPRARRALRRGQPRGRLPGARGPQGAVARAGRARRRRELRPDPLPHPRRGAR